ncbi:unannotated protein [freshwater metagenome]|uniref:Unannotated protein n=1 Tax=freshwater metagenome TaxID=449393 RepID=A0A6J7R0F3_9ZZZZ
MTIRKQYIINYTILISQFSLLLVFIITEDKTVRMFLLLNIVCLSFVKWDRGPGAPGKRIVRKLRPRQVVQNS